MRPQLQRQAVYRGNFKFHQITVLMRDPDRPSQRVFCLRPTLQYSEIAPLPPPYWTQCSKGERWIKKHSYSRSRVACTANALPPINHSQHPKGGLHRKRPARHQSRVNFKGRVVGDERLELPTSSV